MKTVEQLQQRIEELEKELIDVKHDLSETEKSLADAEDEASEWEDKYDKAAEEIFILQGSDYLTDYETHNFGIGKIFVKTDNILLQDAVNYMVNLLHAKYS